MDDKHKGTRLDPTIAAVRQAFRDALTGDGEVPQCDSGAEIQHTTDEQICITGTGPEHVRQQVDALAADGWVLRGDIMRDPRKGWGAILERPAKAPDIRSFKFESFIRAESKEHLMSALREIVRRINEGLEPGAITRHGVGASYSIDEETDADISRQQAIREAAIDCLYKDEECEIDSDAAISEGDDNGCYVQAHVWFSFVGTPWDKEAEV